MQVLSGVKFTTTTTILWFSGLCLGQPGWAGTSINIHPLTPIVVINHPLSASSICYDPRNSPCSIYVPDSLFPQSLSKFSLVYFLAWHPPLHTPYISGVKFTTLANRQDSNNCNSLWKITSSMIMRHVMKLVTHETITVFIFIFNGIIIFLPHKIILE